MLRLLHLKYFATHLNYIITFSILVSSPLVDSGFFFNQLDPPHWCRLYLVDMLVFQRNWFFQKNNISSLVATQKGCLKVFNFCCLSQILTSGRTSDIWKKFRTTSLFANASEESNG